MKEIFIVVLIMVSLVPFVNAQSINTTKFCIDNSTLFITTALVIQELPKPPKTLIINETIVCPFGCDLSSNKCIPSPTERWIIVIGIIAFISIVIYLVYRWYLVRF
jgi:hypothetical protein